jgi:deoxyribonuclease V
MLYIEESHMDSAPPDNPPLGDSSLTYAEAVSIQARLRERLITIPPSGPIRVVAGADVAFSEKNLAVAGIVAFTWPDLDLIDIAVASMKVTFPYIPGLLSFREVPVVAKAFSRLSVRPDVLFCDGQGTAHPRGFGFACHVGVVLDIPTIGAAKSRLVGDADDPAPERGSSTPLVYKGLTVGRLVRTRDRVKPLYISPGHRMDTDTAVRMVLAACRGYRLPEPTRQADILVAKAKKLFV